LQNSFDFQQSKRFDSRTTVFTFAGNKSMNV